MKKIFLPIILFFVLCFSNAQEFTSIPDSAFEQALIAQGYDNILDGQILTSAAQTVTRLEMSNSNPKITNISGIEAFVNLEYFEAIDNSIKILDFSQNLKLQEIRCWHNSSSDRTVELLDVTGLTDLTYVGLDNNLIRVADFTTNSSLEIVGIQNNNLTSLRFHPNANLTFLRIGENPTITTIDISSNDTNLTTFRAINNPSLSCVQVNSIGNATTNAGWEEDSTSIYSNTTCSEADFTVIPDSEFERYLIDQSLDTGAEDGLVLTSNITSVGAITPPTSYNIIELTGVEAFNSLTEITVNGSLQVPPFLGNNTNLTVLRLNNNPSLTQVSLKRNVNLEYLEIQECNLTSLDVSRNTQLIQLFAFANNLEYLDVSENTALVNLGVSSNNFSTLNITQNTLLQTLAIENNNLSEINLTANSVLNRLNVSNNPLTELSVKNLSLLTRFYACNLPTELSCIEVSNETDANNSFAGLCPDLSAGFPIGWYRDDTVSYLEDCDEIYVPIPSVTFEEALIAIGIDPNPTVDGQILETIALSTENINVFNRNITSLEGIEQFINLTNLDTGLNDLNAIDLSANRELETLIIGSNNLSDLNLANNDQLTFIDASSNAIQSFTLANPAIIQNLRFGNNELSGNLDFSAYTSIQFLAIDNNNLTQVVLPSVITLNEFWISSNVNLPALDISTIDSNLNRLEAQNLPNLTCIKVSSETNANTQGNWNKDPNTTYSNDCSITNNSPFTITTELEGAGVGPYYVIEEGTSFSLNINAATNAPAGAPYTVEVSFQNYLIDTAGLRTPQAEGDFELTNKTINNHYTFTVNPNTTDGVLQFTSLDDFFNEDTEELLIRIAPVSEGLSILNTANYLVKVSANDPVEVDVSLQGAGNAGVYSIIEGNQFKLLINSLDESLSQFDLNIDLSSSTAEETIDFSYTSSGNLTSFSVIDGTDLEIDFNVNRDIENLENEEITITLPKPNDNYFWSNADANGEVTFTIPIQDAPPFIAKAELTGVTTNFNGEYEIIEGQEFSINFLKVDETLELIPFSIPVNFSFENSTANLNEDFKINSSNYQIEGFIEIVSIIDGNPEQDEFIVINLPRPEQPYVWENANADGGLTFSIRMTDRAYENQVSEYTIKVFSEYFDADLFENIDTELTGPIYRVKENETIRVELEYDQFTSVDKSIEALIENGTAIYQEDVFNYSNTINQSYIFNGNTEISLRFDDQINNESIETFSLKLTPLTNNYSLLDTNGDVLNLNESLTLNFEVENVDKELIETQLIATDVIGAVFNSSNTDDFFKEYSTKEGDTLSIYFNGLQPNFNDGNSYTIDFKIRDDSSVDQNDYNLTVENENGDNLLNNSSDSFQLTVNNTNTYDAKMTIIINNDGVEENGEILAIDFYPDVSFRQNIEDVQKDYAHFNEVDDDSKLIYRFLISEEGETNSLVFAKLTNFGGTEDGDEPDIITCELVDSSGEPFINNTGNTISIPLKYIPFNDTNLDIPLEEISFYIDDNQVSIENLAFNILSGASQSSIQAFYKLEEDTSDLDCNYYYLNLENPSSSYGLTIVNKNSPFLVKIADKSQYLVFIDLIPENIKPVVSIADPDDTYVNEFDCDPTTEDCGFVSKYLVEEGSTINFTLDAAPPVREGEIYSAKLNLKALPNRKDLKTGNNQDISVNIGDDKTYKNITVLKNETDRENIAISVNSDGDKNENESFSVSFSELYGVQHYRFSKRNSRSYDDEFQFEIIDAIPANFNQSAGNNNLIEEDEANQEEDITFTVKLDDKAKINTRVLIEISGDAEIGTDYELLPKNAFTQISENQIVVYINAGEDEKTLQLITKDDPLDDGGEQVKLEIQDEFGYSPGSNLSRIFTISDDDKTNYEANITPSNVTLYEDSEVYPNSYRQTFTVGLDNINDSQNPIEISVLIDNETTADFISDYKLFRLTNGVEEEINALNGLNFNIDVQEQNAEFIIEAVNDNDYVEGNELVLFSIAESTQHGLSTSSSSTVEIINKPEDNTGEPDPNIVLFAQVISSTCDVANKGKIAVVNNSIYPLTAVLYDSQNVVYDTKELEAGQTDTEKPLFNELPSDTYNLYFEFTSEEVNLNEILLPSFQLIVRTGEQARLLTNSIDNFSKVALLKVSGSSSYQVTNGAAVYEFTALSLDEMTLEIPLNNGLNELLIAGSSECQNSIAKNIYLQQVTIYPVPAKEIIYLTGLSTTADSKIDLIDANGRIIFTQDIESNKNDIDIDISSIQSGIYYGLITNESNQKKTFKFIKK